MVQFRHRECLDELILIQNSVGFLRTPAGWWDKLNRTLRRDIPQDEITIGVAAYHDEKELALAQLLVLPFRKQREWRLPNGSRAGPQAAASSPTRRIVVYILL